MLTFLYESEYDPPKDTNPWAFHAQVAAIADKYFIKPLQDLADYKFVKCAEEGPPVNHFSDTIAAVYDVGSDHLKEVLVNNITNSSPKRLLAKFKSFKQDLREVPDFAADVAEGLAEELGVLKQDVAEGLLIPNGTMSHLKWYRCPKATCWDNDVVFCINRTAYSYALISCPYGCSRDRSVGWWQKHAVEFPFARRD